MKGYIDENDYQIEKSGSYSESVFVGNIIEEKYDGKTVLEVRNKIHADEMLEILNTDGSLSQIRMTSPLITKSGQALSEVNHSQFIIIDVDLPPYTILRRVNS